MLFFTLLFVTFNNKFLNYFPSHNQTFNGINVSDEQLSNLVVTSDLVFFLQYAEGQNTFSLFEGIYVNNLSKVVLHIFDIFGTFLGYLLCISVITGIMYLKY